jgi:hypothetical protein
MRLVGRSRTIFCALAAALAAPASAEDAARCCPTPTALSAASPAPCGCPKPPAVNFLAPECECCCLQHSAVDPEMDDGLFSGLLSELPQVPWTPELPSLMFPVIPVPSLPAPQPQPLLGTSWMNRPWHAGWLVGMMFGDDLLGGDLALGEDLIGGYRIGEDMSEFWGWEGRFAFANPGLEDGNVPPQLGSADVWFSDGSVLYYPWGDTQVRPYVSLGAGASGFRFTDDQGRRYRETLFHVPLGIGVKCLYLRWLAVRFDLTQNIALGDGELETMNNVSATAGVEVHFGGRRRSYFPW